MASELIGGLSTNPKDHLGEEEGGEEEGGPDGTLAAGELFWDKLVLFLATLIAALTAVDILTELLGGRAAVVCYVPEELNASESQDNFVQNFCARSVPDTQYLPVFVLIHGILIGAVHYAWKSSFSSRFHYFFSTAKNLARFRDERSGDFPPQNASIVRKLQVEFSAYNRHEVFTWYQLKLLAQFFIAVASVLVSFLVFDNFDVEFRCPQPDLEDSGAWPYPGETVNCIFASLRLFWLVRLVDLILLFLIVLSLTLGVLWSFSRHPDELSTKNAALFSFSTGLESSYYVPKSPFSGFFQSFCCKRCCPTLGDVKAHFLAPRIRNDLDFFRMLLYRADSGLAHAFWEGEVEIEQEALVELDQHLIWVHDVIDEGAHKRVIMGPSVSLEQPFIIHWHI